MEELKALLPEIQEKVEDATEGLKLVKATVGGEQVRRGVFLSKKINYFRIRDAEKIQIILFYKKDFYKNWECTRI